MTIDITQHNVQVTIVRPRENLDALNAPVLRDRLYAMLKNGSDRFVFDLSGLDFMDSTGMAVLVSVLKRARHLNGDVKLVWPEKEGAQRIIRLTKFDRVFEMHHTLEAALRSF